MAIQFLSKGIRGSHFSMSWADVIKTQTTYHHLRLGGSLNSMADALCQPFPSPEEKRERRRGETYELENQTSFNKTITSNNDSNGKRNNENYKKNNIRLLCRPSQKCVPRQLTPLMLQGRDQVVLDWTRQLIGTGFRNAQIQIRGERTKAWSLTNARYERRKQKQDSHVPSALN